MIGSIALAHGSRGSGQSSVVTELARSAQKSDGSLWRPAFLDHHAPTLQDAVSELVALGCRRLVVVPTLLSNAFHTGVDIPAAVATVSSEASVTISAPLGPDPLLFTTLERNVRGALADNDSTRPPHRVVVAAAGTSDAAARDAFRAAVTQWSASQTDIDALPAFIAGGEPDVATAVASVIAQGSVPLVAPFTLAAGSLTERARAEALSGGTDRFLPPLGAAEELVTILLARRDACATV